MKFSENWEKNPKKNQISHEIIERILYTRQNFYLLLTDYVNRLTNNVQIWSV